MNDFSGQNLKLRRKSQKCLRPESHCTPLSSTLFRRGADLGGYRMKPPVHQRAQVLQGKTTGYRQQCRNCRVSPWQLLSVLEPYRNVCPRPPSTEPPKEARLIPEPNPWWENKQSQDLTAQRRIFSTLSKQGERHEDLLNYAPPKAAWPTLSRVHSHPLGVPP